MTASLAPPPRVAGAPPSPEENAVVLRHRRKSATTAIKPAIHRTRPPSSRLHRRNAGLPSSHARRLPSLATSMAGAPFTDAHLHCTRRRLLPPSSRSKTPTGALRAALLPLGLSPCRAEPMKPELGKAAASPSTGRPKTSLPLFLSVPPPLLLHPYRHRAAPLTATTRRSNSSPSACRFFSLCVPSPNALLTVPVSVPPCHRRSPSCSSKIRAVPL